MILHGEVTVRPTHGKSTCKNSNIPYFVLSQPIPFNPIDHKLPSTFTNLAPNPLTQLHHIPSSILTSSMRSSIFLQLALTISYTASIPIQRRSLSQNDIIGLQVASYLENLELSLYTDGCERINDTQWLAAGFPSTFQHDVCTIAEVSLYQRQQYFVSDAAL